MADELVVAFETRFPSGAVVAASIDVSLPGGSVFGIFGPSGAGKTTIVRTIAGLERPDRGTIRFGGDTWFDGRTWVEPQRRRVGYVGQAPALFPHLTVQENIEYWRHAGDGRRAAFSTADLLSMLELEGLASRRPRELSGGQAQRVALARALAPGPRLLVLDEPFSGLDLPVRVRLRGHLRALVERLQIAAILVTHDRTDAIALCRDMAVLAGGRVRQIGPVAEVFRHPADLVVAESVGVESVVPARVARVEAGLVELRVGDTRIRAADSAALPAGADVFACIRAEDVTLERAAPATASARNHLPGRVVRVEAEGHVERVTLDCGFPLVALVTRNAREEMGLEAGSPIVAAVKATNIHLVEKE